MPVMWRAWRASTSLMRAMRAGSGGASISKTGGGNSTLTVRSNGRVNLGGAITNTSTSGVLHTVLWSDYGNTTSFGVSSVPAITTRGGHLWVRSPWCSRWTSRAKPVLAACERTAIGRCTPRRHALIACRATGFLAKRTGRVMR